MVPKIIQQNRFAKRLGIQIKCILPNWLLCILTASILKIAERKTRSTFQKHVHFRFKFCDNVLISQFKINFIL